MTVYVDNYRAKFGRMVMCHMAADNLEELHEMALKIGMKKEWFQKDHYDVSLSRRKLAIQFGAKEVTSRELVKIVRPRPKQ